MFLNQKVWLLVAHRPDILVEAKTCFEFYLILLVLDEQPWQSVEEHFCSSARHWSSACVGTDSLRNHQKDVS